MQRLILSGEQVLNERSGGFRMAASWSTSLVALTTIWSVVASSAWGQSAGGLLPATGFSGAGGNFRAAVESVLPGSKSTVNTGLAWNVTGSIGVSLGAADNAQGTKGGWDLYGDILPAINVTADTRLLQLQLSYDPSLNLYAGAGSQTTLSQGLNASATATLWPEHLFLTVRGTSSTGSRFGGGGVSSSFLSRDEAVTTTSFSVNPYFMQRFGGWGTFTAGVTLTRSLQDSGSSNFNQFVAVNTLNQQSAGSSPGFGTTGNLTTYQEFATFVTGENLGRWQDTVSVTSEQFGGGSFYQGSTRSSLSDALSYALNRTVSLVGSVGYDQIHYPASHYQLNEMSWNGGVRVTPNGDSTLEVRYGRTQGDTDFLVDAHYSPTPRSVLFVRYSNGVGTGLEDQQNLLSTTSVGVGGIFIDRTTGAPVVANSAFGSQFGVSRAKRFSANGSVNLDRDTFSVGITHEDRTQLTPSTSVFGVTTSAGTNTTVTTGTVGWQRSLNPDTSLTGDFSYSVSSAGAYFGNPGESFDTINMTATLTRSFTQTVSGSVQVSHTERTGGALRGVPSSFGGSSAQNAILVGVQKAF